MNADVMEAPVIELADDWEAINAWFLAHNLTDGLPIVPPTQARVAAMTDYVERTLGWQPAVVIGTLAPKRGLATVEKIAANAVMAGCVPEYMPVLIACGLHDSSSYVRCASLSQFSALNCQRRSPRVLSLLFWVP